MAPMGNPILSVMPGTVTYSGGTGNTGYGNHVIVDHGNGFETVYAHFMSNSVSAGQSVAAGQQLGLADSTGNSTGSHLHFEIWDQATKTEVDPTAYLQGAAFTGGNPLIAAIQQAYNLKKGIGVISGSIPYDATQGVSQWTDTVLQALSIVGQPSSYVSDVLWAILNESSGNPNAINNWDSNAQMGDPSRGLMQTIGSTFEAYRNPNLSNNIYDPLSNIVAALNYILGRYGSLETVFAPRRSKWYGYSVGTRYVPEDMLAMIHKGEAILPASQNPYAQSGGNYMADLGDAIVSTITPLAPVDSFADTSISRETAEPVASTSESYSSVTPQDNRTINIKIEMTNNIENQSDIDYMVDQMMNRLHQELEQDITIGIGV